MDNQKLENIINLNLNARVFKEIGRADELGSGIRNIFEYHKYYSDNKAKLEENDVFNCVVCTDKNLVTIENDTLNDTLNDRTRSEKILTLIKEKPTITQTELAKKLDVSTETIKRDILKLKKNNQIKRVGSDKTGYWQLIQ